MSELEVVRLIGEIITIVGVLWAGGRWVIRAIAGRLQDMEKRFSICLNESTSSINKRLDIMNGTQKATRSDVDWLLGRAGRSRETAEQD